MLGLCKLPSQGAFDLVKDRCTGGSQILGSESTNMFEIGTCTVNRMIGYSWQVYPISGPTPSFQSLDMNLQRG